MPITLTCRQCSCSYRISIKYTWRGTRQFCSLACRWAWHKAHFADAFWERVDKSGGPDACWPWTGYRDIRGQYGAFNTVGGRRARAPRLAYELAVGPISDGDFILHSCNNPPCCNPKHLRPGTPKDNCDDVLKSRGRYAHAKLLPHQVREIRASTKLLKEIAARYGVAIGTVYSIRKRRTWAHLS